MDKETAEKMVAEHEDAAFNYKSRNGLGGSVERLDLARDELIEALTQPPVVTTDHKPQGEVSVETAFADGYHTGYADGRGPGFYLEEAWNIYKKTIQPTTEAARVTPSKPAEPLHNKSAEWQSGYLWGLSGAAEVKESHERLLEAATSVVMLWDIGSDDRLKNGIKLLITAIEAQGEDGKG